MFGMELGVLLALVMKNQIYVMYLVFVMLIAGITKKYNLFSDFFGFINSKIKSKKLVIFLTSMVSGMMPVPGRVTVTAGLLDNIAPSKESNPEKRAKFGIIDYLSTHHYYLWSPLEKSIIIPMAALGLTYSALMSIIWPLLLVTVIIVAGYIMYFVKEEDIIFENIKKDYSITNLIKNVFPFFTGIGFLIAGFNPALVFGVVFAYYFAFNRINWKEAYEFINFKLVFALMGIIGTTNIIKANTAVITKYVMTLGLGMDTVLGFGLISLVAFGSAFLMGSSSRYAGIVALLSTTFGIQYLVYFIAVEFSAYLVSPFHKCFMIGKMYFGTPLKEYYKVIGIWIIVLILTGGLLVLF